MQTFESGKRKGKVQGGFQQRRGGDSNGPTPHDVSEIAAKVDRTGAVRWTHRNTAVFTSGAAKSDCLPTQNPHDVAHNEKGNFGLYKVGARVRGAKGVQVARDVTPRMHHKSEYFEPVPGVIVHNEQVFDDTAERAAMLKAEGIDLVGVKTSLERQVSKIGSGFRDATRQRTRVR